jgi:hypothetical protein
MQIWVGPKIAGQIKYFNDKSNLVSKSVFGQKLPQYDLFLKTIVFRVWVLISEERKSNPRKSYLRALVRIAKPLYSGGRSSVSGSAPAYARLGSIS